jgi:hypothetical protein
LPVGHDASTMASGIKKLFRFAYYASSVLTVLRLLRRGVQRFRGNK